MLLLADASSSTCCCPRLSVASESAMGAWVPLFQTLVWVILIVGILWRFNAEVRNLIKAIRDRIERGSALEAGPFKLGESAPSQDLVQQREKLRAEVAAAPEASASPRHATAGLPSQRTLGETVLLAEDLAIRYIQAEFGTSASRQVKLGSDVAVDGLVTLPGATYIIEVKYVLRALDLDTLRSRISRIVNSVSREDRRSTVVILALVYEVEPASVSDKERVSAAFNSFGTLVNLRFFAFADLARSVGLQIDGSN